MAALIFFLLFLILPLLMISQVTTLFYTRSKNFPTLALAFSFAFGMLVIAYLANHYSFYSHPHTPMRKQVLFGIRCLWTYYCVFLILQLSAFYLRDYLGKKVIYIPPVIVGLGVIVLLLNYFSYLFVR